MQTPSRWLWLAPLSVSVLSGWLMHHGIATQPLPALPLLPLAAAGSPYPEPNVETSRLAEPAAPTF